MGAGPSLAKFIKSMDDEELAKIVEDAYRLEPQRMEKVFTLAKLRHQEENGQQPSREVDAVDASAAALSAALLQPTTVATSASAPMLGEMMQAQVNAGNPLQQITTESSVEVIADAADNAAVHAIRDPMNALGTFEGHQLRELQPAEKNPHNVQQHALQEQALAHAEALKNGGIGVAPGPVPTAVREVDPEGYAVLYGSCGRDKRYARCSVCYFRGLRCNTAHYCACCQRPVCIRPRKYPGEEHPKICWNVLHMDKDMIQRVEKKKKRKLQALTAATAAPVAMSRSTRLKNGEHNGVEHHDRPDENMDQSTVDLQRAPTIPTVVADVSGAVDL